VSQALIVSQVLLWMLVIGLGVAVIALARQVGILYERVAPAGALAMNQTLKVGSKVPALRVETLDGKKIDLATPTPKARLLFFLSPSCPVCKTLLPVLRSVARDERRSVEVTLASDGEPNAHRAFVHAHQLEGFDYVMSEVLGRTLGVSKLPYGVLIKEDGVIASFGIVNSREHLESLIEARERGLASIQEFMNRSHAEHHEQHSQEVVRAIP
jgi:methylamine dehydrogenase accessory protein MauD